jgi:hypothetical protein
MLLYEGLHTVPVTNLFIS